MDNFEIRTFDIDIDDRDRVFCYECYKELNREQHRVCAHGGGVISLCFECVRKMFLMVIKHGKNPMPTNDKDLPILKVNGYELGSIAIVSTTSDFNVIAYTVQ